MKLECLFRKEKQGVGTWVALLILCFPPVSARVCVWGEGGAATLTSTLCFFCFSHSCISLPTDASFAAKNIWSPIEQILREAFNRRVATISSIAIHLKTVSTAEKKDNTNN